MFLPHPTDISLNNPLVCPQHRQPDRLSPATPRHLPMRPRLLPHSCGCQRSNGSTGRTRGRRIATTKPPSANTNTPFRGLSKHIDTLQRTVPRPPPQFEEPARKNDPRKHRKRQIRRGRRKNTHSMKLLCHSERRRLRHRNHTRARTCSNNVRILFIRNPLTILQSHGPTVTTPSTRFTTHSRTALARSST